MPSTTDQSVLDLGSRSSGCSGLASLEKRPRSVRRGCCDVGDVRATAYGLDGRVRSDLFRCPHSSGVEALSSVSWGSSNLGALWSVIMERVRPPSREEGGKISVSPTFARPVCGLYEEIGRLRCWISVSWARYLPLARSAKCWERIQ